MYGYGARDTLGRPSSFRLLLPGLCVHLALDADVLVIPRFQFLGLPPPPFRIILILGPFFLIHSSIPISCLFSPPCFRQITRLFAHSSRIILFPCLCFPLLAFSRCQALKQHFPLTTNTTTPHLFFILVSPLSSCLIVSPSSLFPLGNISQAKKKRPLDPLHSFSTRAPA